MKLCFLLLILDIAIVLLRWADVFYLAAWQAHANALPRRARDDELIRDTIRREGLMQ